MEPLLHVEDVKRQEQNISPQALNAELLLANIEDSKSLSSALASEHAAIRKYFLEEINPNTVFFHNLEEKLEYLISNKYWDPMLREKYEFSFVKRLFQQIYGHKYRFKTYMGAVKFYQTYALKTNDGARILERYEDRICVVALFLADGNKQLATKLAEEMITGVFQPATPTFLNAGKPNSGELVSCHLLDVQDNMESIGRCVNSALQLSKLGGGVGINLTNLRETGAMIRGKEGVASGVVPVMKILEDSFKYANQLGARQGAGAVYLSIFHPDVALALDTKRENADEAIRIKSLSLGLIVPDIAFELLKNDEDMYLFSPYDVAREYPGETLSTINITEHYREMVINPRINKKKLSARKFFNAVAEVQMESGYPYMLFIDQANREHPNRNIAPIQMSNLCVTGDSMLLTKKGYVRADKLYEEQTVFRAYADKRTIKDDRVDDSCALVEVDSSQMMQTQKLAQIYRTVTDNGFEIRSTWWHKFYVKKDDGIIEKKHLKDLSKGDTLLLQSSPVFHNEYQTRASRDEFYMLGIIAAKSIWMRHPIFWGQDAVGKLLKIFGRLADNRAVWTGRAEHRVGASSLYAIQDLEDYIKHELCDTVNLSDPENLLEFVLRHSHTSTVGFWEGFLEMSPPLREDYIIFNCETPRFAKLLQLIALNSGVMIKRDKAKLYLTDHVLSGLSTFVQDGKQTESPLLFDRIEAITSEGWEPVYDVTSKPYHSIIFDGIATGNCSEILQLQTASVMRPDLSYLRTGFDVSCNLGSVNIAKLLEAGNIEQSVDVAMRALTAVSDRSNFDVVPPIQNANKKLHSVGLGAMNLHGALTQCGLFYGSPESIEFSSALFSAINYYSIKTSAKLAKERKMVYEGYERSDYANGKYWERYQKDFRPQSPQIVNVFKKYGITIPSPEDWEGLRLYVQKYGLFNAYRLAIPPTGSISYLANSTPSVWPIVSTVETRKEGKTGRIYVPAYGLTPKTIKFYGKDYTAFELGFKKIIDLVAAIQQHVDQGISLNVWLKYGLGTMAISKAHIYAWSKGIKTLYYVRLGAKALEGSLEPWQRAKQGVIMSKNSASNTQINEVKLDDGDECEACQL